jgi:hypothetical protein
MKSTRILFLLSWVMLAVVMALTVLASAQSLAIAYYGPPDSITTAIAPDQAVQQSGDDVVKTLRGRRATASTWALGCSLLGLIVVLFPYRRGEHWAWWAILLSLGLSQFLSTGRIVVLGTAHGAGIPAIILGATLLALLAAVPHLFKRGTVAKVE